MSALHLADRDPITLDELNSRAAMLTRIDRKYVLTPAASNAFVAALPGDVRVLEIGGLRRFAYHSTYFDTADLESFRATAHRRRRRYKVRTRTYLDSDLSFLEVKTKRGASTVKQRTPWASARALDAEARSFVRQALSNEEVSLPPPLVPTLDVAYARSTLLLAHDTGRLTLDSGLAWTDLSTGRTVTPADIVVVETKSGSSPSSADRLLWRQGHRPVGISKYATGLAAVRPTLPRNRWHRLLDATPSTEDVSQAAPHGLSGD